MSAVATTPTAPARPARRSRLHRLLTSSVGLKIVIAVTGVILSGFVLGHMLGNLQVFQGAESIDAYGKLLHREPALLWAVRLVLLSAVGLHIAAFLVLVRRNTSARAVGYSEVRHKESSFASRSMRFTGPLILLFIVYHILHMTTGTVHPDFHEGTVYANLVTGLRSVPVALFYVLAMAALAFHLWHGVWSMFQTLGLSQPRYRSFGRRFATAFTLLVCLGFAAVPLAVMFGIVK
jgi:succinate dehydrogenase / fumarate reductase cytochrome b subunit